MNPLDPGYFHSAELREFGFRAVGDDVRISKACNIVGLENIFIGDHVQIDAFTSVVAVNGWVELEGYNHIGATCLLGARGGIRMRKFSGLSQGVRIYSASDDYSGAHMTNSTVPSEFRKANVATVELHRHVIVGSGAIIMPGVEVGEGSAVGALSFVHRSLEPWRIFFGSPAVCIQARKRDLLALEAQLEGR